MSPSSYTCIQKEVICDISTLPQVSAIKQGLVPLSPEGVAVSIILLASSCFVETDKVLVRIIQLFFTKN